MTVGEVIQKEKRLEWQETAGKAKGEMRAGWEKLSNCWDKVT
jgi:hypothetical protein